MNSFLRTDMIAPCLYEIHHDPRNFPEPHKFDPARFLDPAGEKFVPHPALVPYGFGKRDESCYNDLSTLIKSDIEINSIPGLSDTV